MTAATGGELQRLSALIVRQREELDRLTDETAARSVVDLARGVLMERLGCSAAEARAQLEHLSRESSTSVTELAAQIAGQLVPGTGTGPWPPRTAAGVALTTVAAELAADGGRVAAAVLEEALAPAGAVAVALWLADPDGGLELAGEAGFGARQASRWRRIHPDMENVAIPVAGGGPDVWWPAGRPESTSAPLIGQWPGGARAVLQLPGSVPGAMEVCWPDPLPEFSDPVRRHLAAIAGVCSQALGARPESGELAADRRESWVFGLLDSLPGSALFARAVRGESTQVAGFRICYLSDSFADPAGRCPQDLLGRPLLEVYPAAALPGGLFERAVEVMKTGEPQEAAGEVMSAGLGSSSAPVTEVRISRHYDGVIVTWRPADEIARLTTLLQQAQRLGRIGGWEENLLTGDVLWTEPTFGLFGQPADAPITISELHEHVPADSVHAVERFRDALLKEQRGTAAAFRIVRGDDQSVRHMRAFAEPVTDGARNLVAIRGAYQDVSADYHTQVAFAATRDRLADTEERAEEERRLALRLQQAITPQAAVPIETPGLEIAARYRPAGEGSLVSGDWYDAVLLPSNQVLLVVGDIAGHGIDAVTGMVALRNCLRGLAVTGAGPATLLQWLNRTACHLTDGIIGTAVCGLYDPSHRAIRWARAGHLPPVLVRNGAASQLCLPTGILLGADPDISYQETTTSLEPGDSIVLFTDGLIERRDEAIDDSLDSLLRAASMPSSDIDGFADRLLRHARSNTSDDACLVAVRVL